MSVEADLIAALVAATGVSFSVWGGIQNPSYPYGTIQRISTAGASHLNGPNSLEWPRFQIDVWALKALEASNIAEAVRLAIDNVTVAGFSATFQDQSGPSPDSETRSFRVSSDYLLFHTR